MTKRSLGFEACFANAKKAAFLLAAALSSEEQLPAAPCLSRIPARLLSDRRCPLIGLLPRSPQLSIQLEAIPDTADAQGFIVGSESGDWQDEMGLR